jgi:hypothetical protein
VLTGGHVPFQNVTKCFMEQVNEAVRFWTCCREVLETRLRLFTDYHDWGLSGFAQTNVRKIIL